MWKWLQASSRGQAMEEYVLVTFVLVGAVVIGLSLLGGQIAVMFNLANHAL